MKRKLLLLTLLSFYFCLLSSQVRVRVLTDNNPQYLFFTVQAGKYRINNYSSDPIYISEGDVVVLALYKDRVAVKIRNSRGFAADSVYLGATNKNDRFSLRTNDNSKINHAYSGDLQCIADLNSLLFINVCDVEDYVAGVVKAEGGNGKKAEYYKTQAIIARTYTYGYFSRHVLDRYNLCDDTHCQVFNGITSDSLINRATLDTKDTVIVTPDSNLIISAFHSNCGGETSPSEYIWPSGHSYLVKVKDPYCQKTKNATWEKVIPLQAWLEMLRRNGYTGSADSTSSFSFSQPARVQDYVKDSFRLPFNRIREDLNLRSSWFSVRTMGDSLRLSGRGYGHGVGLCQEGAMVMAGKGFGYRNIITFYYPGVKLMSVSDAKKNKEERTGGKN
jgi:stage II sporulation protein D